MVKTKEVFNKNRLIFKIIRYSGLPFLFREIIQRNKITIILFHNPSFKDMDTVFLFLKKKYNIISLKSYVNCIYNKKECNLPPKALIITFDDGWKENYNLLPLIKKYDVPITIFLCAGIVGTSRHFWWTHKIPGYSTQTLKNLPNQERLKLLKKYGFEQEKEYPDRQALSCDEINDTKNFVDFQSHTLFHPSLPHCTYEEAVREIKGSKRILEEKFGLDIYAISYPLGDYSERDIKICKDIGYKCGITVDFGFNRVDTDPFRLKRLSVNDSGNLDEIIVKTSGVWMFFKKLFKKDLGYGEVSI